LILTPLFELGTLLDHIGKEGIPLEILHFGGALYGIHLKDAYHSGKERKYGNA
jgi:hypothetical protein